MSTKETKELIRKILEEEDEVEYNIFNKTMSDFLISEIQKYSDYSEKTNPNAEFYEYLAVK